jgi:hypothetical protein
LSEVFAFLVILGEVLAVLLPIGLSGVAAYYAYKQYSRRPKLKFYLQNGEYDPVLYNTKRGTADVYCYLANVGNVAAHNVHGWLRYGDGPADIRPEEDEYRGITSGFDDNTATVYLERLTPNPPWGAEETGFIDAPKLYSFPVEVWMTGPVKLKYRFICDEGASTEGTLDLYFSHTQG